jgi:hypothetical protein
VSAACERCGRSAAEAPFGELNYSEALDSQTCLNCHDRSAALERSTPERRPSNVSSPSPAVAPEDEEAPSPSPLSLVVPSPSSLVPSFIQDGERDFDVEENEVESLLRAAAVERPSVPVGQGPVRVEPVPVELPPLPDSATPSMRKVADFYVLVRGVRLWAGDDRDVPFACGWVAQKVGLTKVTVWRALEQLAAAGVLVRTGALPGRGKRGTHLWTPGVLPGSTVTVEDGAEVVDDRVEVEAELRDEALVGGRDARRLVGAAAVGRVGHTTDRTPLGGRLS